MKKASPLNNVVLLDVGPAKISLINEVMRINGLSLAGATDLVEACPAVIRKGLPKFEAEAVAEKLRKAGAVCEVKS